MASPTRIKGGKIRVLLQDTNSPTAYTAPCGLTSRSVSFGKGLNEYQLPNCEDPDSVDWLGRDATSLSMSVSGEGVLAAESIERWLEAWEDVESVNVKVEWEFPLKTYTWTGKMHVENIEVTAQNAQTATMNVSLQSDGEMLRA
jgi:TP901-1 family phage major tail protein